MYLSCAQIILQIPNVILLIFASQRCTPTRQSRDRQHEIRDQEIYKIINPNNEGIKNNLP